MKFALSALALAGSVEAALRFGCATLSIQRLDPIVQPGVIPSGHLHQIVGGNAFNATMTGNIGNKANCTTCTFSQDFSNYWTAVMYFRAANGSYKRVPLMQNTALPNGINGGMTIYYTQKDFNSNGDQKITAFKPGFRMTVGSPLTSSLAAAEGHVGLRFVCLDTKGTRFPELPVFPNRPCVGGIMTVHHFPSCWDGVHLDSPNHQSHMYDTQGEAFTNAAPCPESHPVRMPQVAYETLWDTTGFNHLWPEDNTNPFVLSYNDAHGYGTHADYMFGWKGDSLQKAMDSTCMFQECENGHPLLSQSVADQNSCTIESTAHDQIDGWVKELPGQSIPMV